MRADMLTGSASPSWMTMPQRPILRLHATSCPAGKARGRIIRRRVPDLMRELRDRRARIDADLADIDARLRKLERKGKRSA